MAISKLELEKAIENGEKCSDIQAKIQKLKE